jgi:Holliday junction resolvasome RuvABC endonuclease subunit
MIILSIDPGTRRRNPAGIVVIDFGPAQPQLLHARTEHGATWEEATRNVTSTVLRLRVDYFFEAIAYEYPFVGKFQDKDGETTTNPQTAIKLAHFGGVAMACGAFCDVPVISVYPGQAKAALAGDSQADKAAMVKMARLLLGLDRDLSEHESDAVGVGLFAAGVLKERAILLQAAIAAERTDRR